jgi:hypothetical protein
LISAFENGTPLRPTLAYVLRVYMESKLAAPIHRLFSKAAVLYRA